MSTGDVGMPSTVPVTSAPLAARCRTTGTLLPSKSNAPFQSPSRPAGQARAARNKNKAVTVHARFIAESPQGNIVSATPASRAAQFFVLADFCVSTNAATLLLSIKVTPVSTNVGRGENESREKLSSSEAGGWWCNSSSILMLRKAMAKGFWPSVAGITPFWMPAIVRCSASLDALNRALVRVHSHYQLAGHLLAGEDVGHFRCGSRDQADKHAHRFFLV